MKNIAITTASGSKNARNNSIDLLRILSMLMVVTLHFLGKGKILGEAPFLSFNYIWAWFSEALCIVAVNCYVLISGYFLITSKFKIKKIIQLWSQIFFYSVIIYLVLLAFGQVQFGLRNTINCFFPVLTSQYWFATSYIALYLLFPFLNILIKAMTKRQMQTLWLLLFLMFSVWKTIFPFSGTLDATKGYGIIWFTFLYFTAAYIRLHYKSSASKYKYLFAYLATTLFVLLSKIALVLLKDTPLGKISSSAFYDYNSVTILLSSVALFMFFKSITIKGNLTNKLIASISGLTFGVYLIHEQILFRSILWSKLLHVSHYANSDYLIIFAAVTILALFAICLLIESIRKKIFSFFENSRIYNETCDKLVSMKDKFLTRFSS